MAAKIEGLQASIVDVWGGDRVQGFVVCSDRDGRNELDLIDAALGQFPRRNVSLAYDPYSDMVGAFSRRESDSGARVYPFRLVVDPQGVIAYSDQNAGLEGVVAFLNSQLGR